MAVSAVALATANCASNQTAKLASGSSVDPKYGVKASPRLYNEGDEIPKGGGRRYTGKPYVVAGQTYTPRENPKGYVREGLASWYGSAFHGRMTANGEVFDRHSIAAAHPTMPLPSYARVTNLENGSSMIVRVNDRGPYHAGRVMDVSEEAAEALGFHRRGTAHVRVEYVGKASLAGSDDRKLLATLRTDGRPAGPSTVMMADLGPSEETEHFSRSPTPLAFKPAPEREEPAEEAPRRVHAPVVLASATVPVPAAVQPTAPHSHDFKPAPVRVAAAAVPATTVSGVKVAGLNPGTGRPSPAAPGRIDGAKALAGHRESLAPSKVAALTPASTSLRGTSLQSTSLRGTAHGAAPAVPEVHKVAASRPVPAAMPNSAKLAMARLAVQAAPEAKAPAHSGAKKAEPASRKSEVATHVQAKGERYAGIY